MSARPFQGRSERRSKFVQDKSDIVQKEIICWGSD